MTRYESHLQCLREMSKTCPLVAELADDFEELVRQVNFFLRVIQISQTTNIFSPELFVMYKDRLRELLNKEYTLEEDA